MLHKGVALFAILVVGLVFAATTRIRPDRNNDSVTSSPTEVSTPASDIAATRMSKEGGMLEVHEALRLAIVAIEPLDPEYISFPPEDTRFEIERDKSSKRWIIYLDRLHRVPDLEGRVAVDDTGKVSSLP